MTKDLALVKAGKSSVPSDSYLNTEDFITAVAENLNKTIKIVQ